MGTIPQIGAEYAGYRIDGLLGRGGMSVVFRAENPRLGNLIALKLLGLGTAGVGLLQAACGVGALVGAAVALSLVARARIAADFAIGLLLFYPISKKHAYETRDKLEARRGSIAS